MEIMIVVVIIGLLAAMAIPAFKRVQRRSVNTTMANDFRVFAQAFETYSMENGKWPANAGAGVVPPGMNAANLKVNVWKAKTPIGGQWNWDDNVGLGGFVAGISVSNFTCDDAQLTEIDTMIDDGNLNTGNFQKVANNRVTMGLQ